jgi:hypothetical protein
MFMVPRKCNFKNNQDIFTEKESYHGKLTAVGVSRSHFVAVVKIVAFVCVVELTLKEQYDITITLKSIINVHYPI